VSEEKVVSNNVDALRAGGFFWLLASLGVEICVEITEGLAANAARTYIDMHGPETISARVDYHPDKTGLVAFAGQHEISFEMEMGPPCLVIEEDLGGYKPVLSAFGLREEDVPSERWFLLDRSSRPYTWNVPTRTAEYGSATFHRWLGTRAEGGEIPPHLNDVLHHSAVEYRYESEEMFRWLLGVFGVMKSPHERGLLFEVLQYLMELRNFIRGQGLPDSWPVAIGWSVRLSAYSLLVRKRRPLEGLTGVGIESLI